MKETVVPVRKRIEWVDIVKFICITLVMIQHLESVNPLFRTFYLPFLLNPFFFVAGYVYKDNLPFPALMAKKARTLMIPWFFLGLFNIILSHIITFNTHDSLKNELLWSLVQVRGHADQLWFIACMFIIFIPFYFIVKMKRRNAFILVAVMTLLTEIYRAYMPADVFPWGDNQLPWHLQLLFPYMVFMLSGYYFKDIEKVFFEKAKDIKMLVLVWGVYLVLTYFNYTFHDSYPFLISVFMNYLLRFLGVAGVIMIAKKMKMNRYIAFVGANTLIYFALHGKVECIVQKLLSYASLHGEQISQILPLSVVYSFVVAEIVSVILIIPTVIIKRYFPFIMGKWYKKNEIYSK